MRFQYVRKFWYLILKFVAVAKFKALNWNILMTVISDFDFYIPRCTGI